MAAIVRTADPHDLSQPYGCLFVVDQIKKADNMFQQIDKLLLGQVAVWTTDHDVNAGRPTQMYVPPERRFHVDQLEQHAVAVVTQAFLRAPRGDKARQVIRGDQRVPRALTIFDEQTRDASNTKDRIAADLAAKQIESGIEARKQASAIIIAEQGRWYTAIIRPLLAIPVIIYFWKVIVWDKVLGLGSTDPITGMVEDWTGMILTAYVGGRSIEKVARIFARRP